MLFKLKCGFNFINKKFIKVEEKESDLINDHFSLLGFI